MKRVLIVSVVFALVAMAANADVISDYTVKVNDGTPSYPIRLGTVWMPGGVGKPAWGESGGNFQYWIADQSPGTMMTATGTYDDTNFAVALGTESTCQIELGGGPCYLFSWYGGTAAGDHSFARPYDDYGAGDQLVKMFTWDVENAFYGIATDATGITFTTPAYATLINVFSYHKTSSISGAAYWTQVALPMLGGGYYATLGDNQAGAHSQFTACTAVPEALWQNIDLPEGTAAAWGEPDSDTYLGWDGTLIRLCDNNIASTHSRVHHGTFGEGAGLWLNTVGDNVAGKDAVKDGWRNDPDNTSSRSLEPCLLNGRLNNTQVATPDSTRTFLYDTHLITLKAREQDTATQWFVLYTGCWPSRGLGYAKLMITAQKGDLNYDGKCDFADLPIFSGAFGTSLGDAGYNVDADMDGNNKVDFQDLPLFSGYFGQQCQ